MSALAGEGQLFGHLIAPNLRRRPPRAWSAIGPEADSSILLIELITNALTLSHNSHADLGRDQARNDLFAACTCMFRDRGEGYVCDTKRKIGRQERPRSRANDVAGAEKRVGRREGAERAPLRLRDDRESDLVRRVGPAKAFARNEVEVGALEKKTRACQYCAAA